jgi:hypothetical protein
MPAMLSVLSFLVVATCCNCRLSPAMEDSVAQLGAFVGATTPKPPPPKPYVGYDDVFKTHYPKFFKVHCCCFPLTASAVVWCFFLPDYVKPGRV